MNMYIDKVIKNISKMILQVCNPMILNDKTVFYFQFCFIYCYRYLQCVFDVNRELFRVSIHFIFLEMLFK